MDRTFILAKDYKQKDIQPKVNGRKAGFGGKDVPKTRR